MAPTLSERLRAARDQKATTTTACKICAAEALLFDVVDFYKTRAWRFPLIRVPVHYHRCTRCGFIFTRDMDDFSPEDFGEFVYNDEYAQVDVDFAEKRPKASAAVIEKMFGHAKADIALLDYGGGGGVMAEALAVQGWTCTSYDPFFGNNAPTGGPFDRISCFEVFEHTPDPRATLEDLLRYRKTDGLVLFSTLVQPDNIDEMRLAWWYANPRNGHISLFSRKSLQTLLAEAGMRMGSLNDDLHIAFTSVPPFAEKLFAGAKAENNQTQP